MTSSLRDLVLPKDGEPILEYHCRINYACDTRSLPLGDYSAYRVQGFVTNQAADFLGTFEGSLTDHRNFARIILDPEHAPIGYVWPR